MTTDRSPWKARALKGSHSRFSLAERATCKAGRRGKVGLCSKGGAGMLPFLFSHRFVLYVRARVAYGCRDVAGAKPLRMILRVALVWRRQDVVVVVDDCGAGLGLQAFDWNLLLDGFIAIHAGASEEVHVVFAKVEVEGDEHGELVVHIRLRQLQAENDVSVGPDGERRSEEH